MKTLIYEIFADYKTQIIFLHVISAVVWVGGMVAMRFAAHQSIQEIESPMHRIERAAHALKRLFWIVTPFMITLIITAVIMAVGLGFREAAVDANHNVIDEGAMLLYNLIHVKEAIWMVMGANLALMMFLRNKAEKYLKFGDALGARAKLGLIAKYMVPLNIVLGVIAIYLGVFLRNSY